METVVALASLVTRFPTLADMLFQFLRLVESLEAQARTTAGPDLSTVEGQVEDAADRLDLVPPEQAHLPGNEIGDVLSPEGLDDRGTGGLDAPEHDADVRVATGLGIHHLSDLTGDPSGLSVGRVGTDAKDLSGLRAVRPNGVP